MSSSSTMTRRRPRVKSFTVIEDGAAARKTWANGSAMNGKRMQIETDDVNVMGEPVSEDKTTITLVYPVNPRRREFETIRIAKARIVRRAVLS